ncbi:MAG: hypothetical protein LBK47_05030 [Prevotellaceae bacterium]|jgi:hypothetical protein|nr:hypothetical protein [Prevotellaceae bacterium]
MELIVQILMLFIVVNCIFKLSFWKWWQALIFALLCAGCIVAGYPLAILQSKTQIADYLQNAKAMQNAAILVTIESMVCFGFCFAALGSLFGKKASQWVKALFWYPGLLIFPVLFYVLTQTIFALPGITFSAIANNLAIIILAVLPLLSYSIKRLIPENELRLEVHFLVSLFVCILGLITTVNGNVAYAVASEPINTKATMLSVGLFLLMFLAGIAVHKLRWIIFRKKQRKTK